jgi:hypothetical protein
MGLSIRQLPFGEFLKNSCGRATTPPSREAGVTIASIPQVFGGAIQPLCSGFIFSEFRVANFTGRSSTTLRPPQAAQFRDNS